jgi:type VII secretion-associated serine protease mycosin
VSRYVRRLVPVVLVTALAVLRPAAGYADEVRDGQWHVTSLDLAGAHRLSRGEGVTVAIIDSGVDAAHPDLRDNLLPGVDLLEPDNDDAWTPEEHGTLVAGVLAGHGHGPGGGDGVLGVAPDATILPLRASSDEDAGGDSQPRSSLLADGIRLAVERGASVISISLSASERSEVDERAIEAARRADVVVVAAAGNRPDAEGVTFPAALPTVVAVGGVAEDGSLAEFSVTGPEIALTAPADEIVTTRPGDEYAVASGTSFAAPMVAGTAALVRARFPELTADEVIHRLVSTATDSGPPGRDEQYGNGIVDPVAALTAQLPAMPPVPDEPDGTRLGQWHLDVLDLAAAHERSRGEGITVALVGSGVDGEHPDLHGNLLPGIDLAEPEHDDAWTPTASGTALAGIIAGHGNRLTDHEPGNRGALGVAPAARLLPVRVNSSTLSDRESVERAAEGIAWAVANGAQVICYAGGSASQDLFAGAIEAARAADVVVVAGVGEGAPADWYPAANPAVVAVAGTGEDGTLAAGINPTTDRVVLAAPGVDVLTTAPAGGYTEDSRAGTAAATVAGAAALVRAAYPDLSADGVVHRLVTTARPVGGRDAPDPAGSGQPGADGPGGRPPDPAGYRGLDLVAALTADVPPPTSAAPLTAPGGAAEPAAGVRDYGALPVVVLAVAAATAGLGAVALLIGRAHRRRGRGPVE